MHVAEQKFAAFLRSRFANLTLIAAGVAMTIAAPELYTLPLLSDTDSTLLVLPFSLAIPAWASALLLLAVTVIMYYINRRFNILRSTRIVYAGLFMLMCGASPAPDNESALSALLAIAMLTSLSVFYSLYHRPRNRRKVLLISVMLGIVALLHRAAVLYLPVLILGLTQMRIFNIRSLAALFIGLLTPAWILWAIFDADFTFSLSVWNESPWKFFSSPAMWQPFAAAIVALLTGFIMGMMVLIKVFTLNARARALNGFLALMAVASGLFIIADYENIYFYLTLLNALVAFQIAHFFRLNRHRSGYLSVTLLILLYAAIYVCPLILS
ncbi:MAG: hypothetical protein K2H98_00160 [Duncaniella sp.]|nr:hypothetical protein [Duncaniella sp.]